MDSGGSRKNVCKAAGLIEWKTRQVVALLRAIKKQESLWNTSSKYYKHKQRKELAWQIVEKEVGLHVNACKRKLESLLASFRRERNKIRLSEKKDSSEHRYEPRWKYWSEMNFLRGLPDTNCKSVDVSSSSEDEDSPLQQWSASARRPHRNRKKQSKFIAPIISNVKSLSEPLESSEVKTSKTQVGEDEHDAFGITVAAKLRKMDETQRLYAENVINQALYKGLTFQLTVQSDVELLQPRLIQSETYSHYHHQQQSQQQQHHHHQSQQQQQQQQQQPSTIYFPTPAPTSPTPSTYIQKDSTHVVVVLDETSEDFKRNDIL